MYLMYIIIQLKNFKIIFNSSKSCSTQRLPLLTGFEKICVRYRTIWIYATLNENYNYFLTFNTPFSTPPFPHQDSPLASINSRRKCDLLCTKPTSNIKLIPKIFKIEISCDTHLF